jgi:uncharacterized protein involved in outer membrane biogenesis
MNSAAAPAKTSRQRLRWRRPSRRTSIVLAVIALAIALLIIFWDWNWFKGPIERQVTARTGREFHIHGDLDVDLGRITVIRADALQFGNAKWSKERTMAAAQKAQMSIEVFPLIF